jgi:hypothetical protein
MFSHETTQILVVQYCRRLDEDREMTTLEDLKAHVWAELLLFEKMRGKIAGHNRRQFATIGIRAVEKGQIDLCAEATVIEFAELFPPETVRLAKVQLRNYREPKENVK